MFKPLKYQKDDETEVIVMYGSRDLFALHQKDVDSTITIRTNEHLNGTEIVSVDNEMSWEKHETAENEYFVKALNCLMPLQVEK